MMLSLLSALSLSASINPTRPEGDRGLFDLRFNDEEYNPHTMTHNNEGVYVGLRVHNTPDDHGNVTTISYSENPKTVNDVTVKNRRKVRNGNREIIFSCENTAFISKFLDLGVFANPDFDGNDNTQVAMRSDRNGFTVTSNDNSLVYTVLFKGTQFKDADTFYLSNIGDTEQRTPASLPFFNNLNDGETPAGDNYAFSWTNVLIQPGETIELGYVMIPSNNVNLPPALRETTVKKESYPKNQDIALTFKVINFNPGQEITFEFSAGLFNQNTQTQTIPDDGSAVTFTVNVNLGDKDSIDYSAYVIAGEYESNEISGTITAEGARAPKFVIDPEIEAKLRSKTTYEPGDVIHIKATVTDDSRSKIKYRFDEWSGGTEDPNFFMDTKGTKLYDSSIQIPAGLEDGPYPFYIWAEDELEHPSEKIKFDITIQTPPEPKVKSAYLSRYKADPNETLIVFGEVTDPNSDDELTIYAKFDKDERVEIGKKTPDSQLASFAYFLKVPEETEVGMHNITIEAKDSNAHEATEVVTKILEVTDPSAVRKQELRGNVTDETAEIESQYETCFNIKYQKPGDRFPIQTSYNNEGYYVGFRTYDDEESPSETQLIKHTEGSKAQLENFSITQRTEYDPVTGYLQVIFDVQNTGYWSKKIDLSVFVDTQIFWSNDHDKIKMRKDGRGVTISDDEKGVFMTFFLRDYGSFPNVDAIFLDGIDRYEDDDGYSEIRISEMPFFRSSEKQESAEDAMLSFSWLKREIMPDTNVSFGFTIAPDSNIKTPTRIVDETETDDVYEQEDSLELKFRIIDGDIGETVVVNLNLNGTNETVEVQIIDQPGGIYINRTVNIGDGPFYTYEVSSRDKDVKFTSNVIRKTIIISNPPGLSLNDFRDRYVEGGKMTISGTISDETQVTVKYQFNNGRIYTLQTYKIRYSFREFENTITLPPELKAGKSYKLKVWAEDEYGIKSEVQSSKSFNVVPAIKPHLLQAGLAYRVSKANKRILGYALIDDDQNDVDIFIWAKINGGDYAPCGQATKSENPALFAFYYTVPEDLSPDTYDLVFIAKDSDDLYSDETIPIPLTVTA